MINNRLQNLTVEGNRIFVAVADVSLFNFNSRNVGLSCWPYKVAMFKSEHTELTGLLTCDRFLFFHETLTPSPHPLPRRFLSDYVLVLFHCGLHDFTLLQCNTCISVLVTLHQYFYCLTFGSVLKSLHWPLWRHWRGWLLTVSLKTYHFVAVAFLVFIFSY